MLGLFTAVIGWRYRDRMDDALVGWAMIVMFLVTAYFALRSGFERRKRERGLAPLPENRQARRHDRREDQRSRDRCSSGSLAPRRLT